MTQRSYTIQAPAKINLGLDIGEHRPDGFHEISTIFQTISLSDQLTVQFSPDRTEDELTINGPVSLAPGEENLVPRTLRRLRNEWNELPHATVQLEKTIPIGAGLGGGSSDAAAVIHACRRCLDKEMSQARLRTLAAELGADVPFFLVGGTAVGEGIGEKLTPVENFEGHVVVAVPPIEVNTEWAYQNFRNCLPDNQFHNNINFHNRLKNGQGWQSLNLSNDFQPLLTEEFDVYNQLLARFREECSHVSLSGSGSAIYMLFDNARQANNVEERLSRQFTDVQFYCEQFVSSDQIPMFTQGVSGRGSHIR